MTMTDGVFLRFEMLYVLASLTLESLRHRFAHHPEGYVS
jgi:hypothetical protein